MLIPKEVHISQGKQSNVSVEIVIKPRHNFENWKMWHLIPCVFIFANL